MIPIFTPATARKDVNKVQGDIELAKLANLNRLVDNINTIVANGLPAASPTLTYTNVGILDSMSVNFSISVPTPTYNLTGTKTIQSYYTPNVIIRGGTNDDFNQSLTSVIFPDVVIINIEVNDIPLIASISIPASIYIVKVILQSLPSLTTFNAPLIGGSINEINLSTLPLLSSFNFSNIVEVINLISVQNTGLTSINCNSLKYFNNLTFANIFIDNNDNLTTVTFPELINIHGNDPQITNNSSLTSLTLGTIGKLKLINGNVYFENNAFNATSINNLLALLVSLDGTNGTTLFLNAVYLTLGTNAAPTGQGIIDKQTLITRGCVVETN